MFGDDDVNSELRMDDHNNIIISSSSIFCSSYSLDWEMQYYQYRTYVRVRIVTDYFNYVKVRSGQFSSDEKKRFYEWYE